MYVCCRHPADGEAIAATNYRSEKIHLENNASHLTPRTCVCSFSILGDSHSVLNVGSLEWLDGLAKTRLSGKPQ